MNDNLITSQIFNEKNITSIILYLHFFGARTRSEIYNIVSTNPRMPVKLDLLSRHGLITMDERENGHRRVVDLTPLGKKYAATICSLEKQSGGNVESFKWDVLRTMLNDAQRGN